MEIVFRPMTEEDWPQVAEIYRQGIKTQNATFERQIPTWEKWNSNHSKTCRILATIENKVIGWAALIPVSARQVYSGVAEVSIYISDKFQGQRIGTRLLKQLIYESEIAGIWTLQAVIFPENILSMAMHENNGFRVVGYRERIGQINGNWRNTILLERRSTKTGTNSNDLTIVST
jgi:L-amino acid N-acyltransferase YncA